MRLPLAASASAGLIALVVPFVVDGAASSSLDPTASPDATTAPPAHHAPVTPRQTAQKTARKTARKAPALKVRTLVGGLDHAWDARSIGGGKVLVGERTKGLIVTDGSTTKRVRFPIDRIWRSGETGLMGLEIDPKFSSNHRFYTCSAWVKKGGGHDVRVIAWRLDGRTAKRREALVTGFPTSSGRHGGCRLLITRGGALMVGTGDAAVGTNPRNLRSLGGKTLRLDRFTGKPRGNNPFLNARNRNKRYITTFGHRNIQGMTQRRDGTVWSIEQGSYRDDEANRLVDGGDYGWNPVPGYNEKVPMTDQRLPGTQINARWRSGKSTIAAAGGTFLYGKQWGSLNGTLAVAALKANRLVFLKFDGKGRLKRATVPTELTTHGRLRTAVQLPDGKLLVCTDGVDGGGEVLVVSPK